MTPRQKEFLKLLTKGHDGEAPARTFERWAEMAFCSIAKTAELKPSEADDLEARYMRAVGQIEKRERVTDYCTMLALASMDIAETGREFLGPIVQHDDVRAVNAHVGQFFTPFDVSEMMAQMTLGDIPKTKPFLTIAEPAVGAGGMVLAAAKVLKAQSYPIDRVWFDATDLSLLCAQMAYIQMALAGLAGIVRHGNTLSLEFWGAWATPKAIDFIASHGWPHAKAA